MPNDNQQLDRDAVNLARAIRQRESGGDFTARGKSGEYGAFQMTKGFWTGRAQKYLGNPNAPLTPQNQNKVAYSQIKEWKDQGYKPDQIASMWNSGKPNYQGNVGVNKFGVQYDTPSYVRGVQQEYQKLKQSEPQRPQAPQGGLVPTANAAEINQPQAPQETGMQKWGRRLDMFLGGGKIGEAIGTQIAKGNLGTTLQKFAVGQDLTPEQEAHVSAGPTGRQLVADAARVGVNFLPVGTMGGAITNRLATEGVKRFARPLGNISSQALAGYAYDVTEGVRQGEEQPLRPGMGTYTGLGFGALGSAGSAGLRKLGQQTGQQKLADLTTSMSSLTNSLNRNTKKGGVTPLQTLEREGLMPTVADGKIVTDEVRAQLQQRLASLAEQTRGVIASSGKEVPWSTFKNEIQTTIKNDKLLQNLGKTETVMKNANVILESYRRSYGNRIPVSAIDDIRKAANTQWKDEVRDMYRAIGDASRKIVYDVVPDNTVRDALRQEGELLAASDFAKSLHGKAVKGGRLGTGMSQIIGGMIGTGAGAMGGPLTSVIAGGLGAAAAGKVSQTFQKNYFKTPLANVARKITNTLDNTPLTPGDRLLQTEAGQRLERSVKESLRNPGAGLSIRDVSGGKPTPKPIVVAKRERDLAKKNDKSLVAVHNLSERKLHFTDRMGGLANPSVAVIDPRLTAFDNYGDISLIADKELLRGAKTHLADAYSPRFPSVHTTMDWKNYKKLDTDLKPYYDKIGKDARELYFDDADMMGIIERNPAVALKFLETKGIKPSTEGQSFYKSQISKAGLDEEYDDFLSSLYKEYGIQEKMFDGYTNSGKRRYKALDVNEASRIMSKQKEEGYNYGLGSYRSKVAPVKTSPEAIKKEAGRLVGRQEFERVKDVYDNELNSLRDELAPFVKNGTKDSNRFVEADNQYNAIGSVLTGEDKGMQFFKYKYENVPPELMQKMSDFREKLRNMPTEYFETKFKRPVDIGEFRVAVIPDTLPEKARDILRKKGIELVPYKKGEKEKTMRELLDRPEAFGIGAGGGLTEIEEDEEGNTKVDPLKLALGLGGGLLGARALATLAKRGRKVPRKVQRRGGEYGGRQGKSVSISEAELKTTHANVQKRLDNARKEGNKITARRLEKEAQRLMDEMQKERMRVIK
jgi:hypothetical protein